jgi:hypothetical protein
VVGFHYLDGLVVQVDPEVQEVQVDRILHQMAREAQVVQGMAVHVLVVLEVLVVQVVLAVQVVMDQVDLVLLHTVYLGMEVPVLEVVEVQVDQVVLVGCFQVIQETVVDLDEVELE